MSSTAQSSSDLTIVPFVDIGDSWILSDEFLTTVFEQTRDEGLLDTVFRNQSLANATDFIEICHNPKKFMAFVFDGKQCAGYAWLSGISDNFAFGHFCLFRSLWGKQTVEVGHMYLDYWFSWQGEDGPLLDTIIGIVPGFNERAHNFVQKIGFQHLGAVPKMLKNRSGDREDAEVFYKSR